nr:MAG TPA: hypothetical protein [Caudoviricetes sp.]
MLGIFRHAHRRITARSRWRGRWSVETPRCEFFP